MDGGEQNLALDERQREIFGAISVFDQGCYLLDVTWRPVIGRDLKQNPHAHDISPEEGNRVFH